MAWSAGVTGAEFGSAAGDVVVVVNFVGLADAVGACFAARASAVALWHRGALRTGGSDRGGAICFAVARWRKQRWLAALGVSLLAQAGLYLHTTVRGRVRVWRRELDRLDLRGNEQLLDVGCGRGAVLVEAAQRLPSGRASAWICGAATTRAAMVPASLLPTPAGWGCPERRRAEDSRPARSVRG